MKAEHWKRIETATVFSHPRMVLVEDTVELPDGKTTKYLRQAVGKTTSVAVIAINDKDEMLLQREYSYPIDKILWQLPGGQALEGEDVVIAANRELSEESGFIGHDCKEIGAYYLDNRRTDVMQHVVVCRNLEQKAGQRDEEEFIESHWVPTAKVKQMITEGECDSAPLLAALNIYLASPLAEA